ncbi:histidinol dehydrogenase [Candidatus Berkiella aquae]|uniref:Histidinol dehydrogenase n=1 Tax=Candidatus Berkiella aquae TaxID=295108 RepID=A0A0Q9YMD0_9GAMM|nr:histidinol dehydrogenase [Candidatus Berkiella aquae]MCS5710405.1 histidinol dehydrogenase [Candidatus Berkiella aquae]
MKIQYWNALSAAQKKQFLQRNTMENNTLNAQVLEIIESVKQKGDEALFQYTQKFDKASLMQLAVTEQELSEAYNQVDEASLAAIRCSIERITAYNRSLLPENGFFDSQDGIICERQIRPINAVGLYIPGGTAPLVSTVMMLSVPASIAGCEQRILCTPPRPDGSIEPSILVAATECGIQTIYKIGGAQAIAAMSYGTQTIPAVDKIFGPGNQWVTKAKQLCAQNAGISIDMPAGPSELLIIADDTANPDFVAADLLSQAEHDVCAQVILVTPDESVAEKVKECLYQQLKALSRYQIAAKSIENSKAIIVGSANEAFEVSNLYAPEHLSIQLPQPEQYGSNVKNAGTVFMGEWAAEALGDYNTGSNHVLPTAGFTRSLSGLSVLDFMKWVSFQYVSQEGLLAIGKHAAQLARLEALSAHENAVNIRLQKVKPCVN